LFSEHNDVGINGEPNDSSGSAIPANAVNGLDEIAKRQCPLLVIGFHTVTISREVLRELWGVHPTGGLIPESCRDQAREAMVNTPYHFAAIPRIFLA
jgi:hypothetical protein